MKILHINTFPYKATGTIMTDIHKLLIQQGNQSYIVWGRGRDPKEENEITIEDKLGIMMHGIYTRITDKTGFASKKATEQLINRIDSINPDIIQLHNLHGYYINIEILFEYLKKSHRKVVWTLHDCWPITGHCAYFSAVGCNKWKTGCKECQQLKTYPTSLLLDNSEWNWKKKKELFTGIDMHIVTVSKWLEGIVKESFLKEYPVHTIYNGLDLMTFYPISGSFREKYHIGNKIIILGVASEWTERKGLRDFIMLSSMLDAKQYQIVLVGLSQKQIKSLPVGIIGIQRTSNVKELAEIYSTADIFFNASVEETMGMTTVEAMACGTVPIVYDATALPEILQDLPELIVPPKDVQAVKQKIEESVYKKYTQEQMIGIASKFNKNEKYQMYIDLYDEIMEERS